jgi:hypothetical protein
MATEPSKKRDLLDYIDIIVKILSGGILVIVSFILSHTNDLKKQENELKQQEINNSLKLGEFTKTLINAMIIEDSTHLQQDLAFITLDHTIGKADPKFVSDLGSRVIEKYLYSKSDKDPGNMQYILRIIKEKDVSAYNELMLKINKQNEALYVKAVNNLSNSPQKDTTALSASFSKKELDKFGLLSKATIFIQIDNGDIPSKEKAAKLQAQLRQNGFNVPGVEAITKFKFQNAIRYYYSSDEGAAQQIKAVVDKLTNQSVKLVKLNNNSTHNGLIELWLNI